MKNGVNDETDSQIDRDKRQDNLHWLNMWKNAQTGEFHQQKVNSLLTRFWHELQLKKHSRVLVPLCGKSLDMIWLAEQGCRVVGIELSPVAVRAFFQENRLKVKKTRHGNFTCWQSGAITIWCGDYFSLREFQLGQIDCVYDRASLTALPVTVRCQYVDQLRGLIGKNTSVFLLTVEEILKSSGLAERHIDSELGELYQKYFNIDLAHVQRVETTDMSSEDQSFYIDYKVYRLTQRAKEPESELNSDHLMTVCRDKR
jgi:thiopurine S-methyltransferase